MLLKQERQGPAAALLERMRADCPYIRSGRYAWSSLMPYRRRRLPHVGDSKLRAASFIRPQASSPRLQAPSSEPRTPRLRLVAWDWWRDHRGVASIEGIIVVSLLGAVFLCCLLLAQWGVHVQSAQMGARLLAFNSGDANLARFGRSADTATQTFSTGRWDTLASGSGLPTNWLNTMFTTLTDDYYSGYVKGRQRGRLTNTGRSLFSFSSRSVGYFSNSAAAFNPWSGTTASARSTFMGIAYYVGRYRVSPQSIGSLPTIPSTIPVLETIYSRIGGR